MSGSRRLECHWRQMETCCRLLPFAGHKTIRRIAEVDTRCHAKNANPAIARNGTRRRCRPKNLSRGSAQSRVLVDKIWPNLASCNGRVMRVGRAASVDSSTQELSTDSSDRDFCAISGSTRGAHSQFIGMSPFLSRSRFPKTSKPLTSGQSV